MRERARVGCWRLGQTTGYDQRSDERDNTEHTYCSESVQLCGRRLKKGQEQRRTARKAAY